MSADTARTPFDPRVIGAVIVIGVIGFIAMWALMALGPQLSAGNNAQGHALSKGVAGYAGIVDYAERADIWVDVRREVVKATPLGDDEGSTLLVLTPDQSSEPDEIEALIKAHGREPVLIVLPKWRSIPHPQRKGWTGIAFPVTARQDLLDKADIGGVGKPRIAPLAATVQTSFAGPSNRRDAVTLAAGNWQRVAPGPRNASLLAVPGSDDALLVRSANRRVYVLADPDLINNFAFASRERARTALAVLDMVAEDSDAGGIAFDVTLNGLGGGSGFLRLAFVPPFIGITACLIAAGLFALWQAAARFGPARVAARAIPISKRALIESSAELVAQTRREADGADAWLRGQREALGRALHAPPGLEGAALDDWIDRRRPARVGGDGFAALARRLPLARNSNELLGLTRALHTIRKDLLREH
ncbi:MAG: DUF4350 domain-containing protein [Sphingopyxis sp.]|nr:DUF4350 domain-containing protein [Sphingopyxis sp.]